MADQQAFSISLLREMRSRADLTREQSAVAAGISVRALAGWEAGEREPRATALADLSNVYGCAVDDFFEDVLAHDTESDTPASAGVKSADGPDPSKSRAAHTAQGA